MVASVASSMSSIAVLRLRQLNLEAVVVTLPFDCGAELLGRGLTTAGIETDPAGREGTHGDLWRVS